jgi:hypothetical protein
MNKLQMRIKALEFCEAVCTKCKRRDKECGGMVEDDPNELSIKVKWNGVKKGFLESEIATGICTIPAKDITEQREEIEKWRKKRLQGLR